MKTMSTIMSMIITMLLGTDEPSKLFVTGDLQQNLQITEPYCPRSSFEKSSTRFAALTGPCDAALRSLTFLTRFLESGSRAETLERSFRDSFIVASERGNRSGRWF